DAATLLGARDRAGFTPLARGLLYVTPEGVDVALALLRRGAQMDARDGDGRTCVHHVAMCANTPELALEALEKLRAHDEAAFARCLAAKSAYGETPLHTACSYGPHNGPLRVDAYMRVIGF